MACPDELTLDLWLADALPPEEAAAIAAHVRTCSACAVSTAAADELGAELHTALALDAEELAFLADLTLAAQWRAATAVSPAWELIALVGVVAGFIAWLLVAPVIGPAVSIAVQVGVLSVLVNAFVGLVLGVGQTFLDLIRNPALGWSQPLLALLALALLFWPRQFIPQRSTHA